MEYKVGETYAIALHVGRYRAVTVERITPTGRIVANGMTFNPDGWERGSHRHGGRKLLPITDEIRGAIEQEMLAHMLSSLTWPHVGYLTLDQLRRIDAILREPRA